MKLRRWQQQCVTTALSLYQTQNHFFCLATPGAGKTVMAASLAKQMLLSKKIDFVMCFSPSTQVNESTRATFEAILNRRIDGKLGSLGSVQTYQSMNTLTSAFWSLIEEHNVMVVLDEVHHLKGHELPCANAWGEEVLVHIQDKAAYTLAMSGTPWRSDQAPISLARFTEPDNTIHCDFSYGLAEAINDGVCRIPQIVLIDNECINVSSEDTSESFESISDLLTNSDIAYQQLVENEQVIRYMLTHAVEKLSELRRTKPNSAGLIVASSIKHAYFIEKLLNTHFNQSTEIVTSKHPDANERIERFNHSNTEWVVSVGMISQGTDIPRLQVCCHLSRIRTEMHYRQVLGRVLRATSTEPQYAWLYTLDHWKLAEFAQRINVDLPEVNVVFKKAESFDAISKNDNEVSSKTFVRSPIESSINISELSTSEVCGNLPNSFSSSPYSEFSITGKFKQRVVALFT